MADSSEPERRTRETVAICRLPFSGPRERAGFSTYLHGSRIFLVGTLITTKSSFWDGRDGAIDGIDDCIEINVVL